MAVAQQGKVGAPLGKMTDNTIADYRYDAYGALVVQDVSGRYREAALRGSLFSAAVPPGTGVAPGTALGITAAYSLFNPAASGKNLVVLRGDMSYISGTLGAGSIVWAAITTVTQAAPTGGTAITPANVLLGSGNLSVAKVGFGTTVSAAPTAVRTLCSTSPLLATTVVQPYTVQDIVDGALIVGQGACLTIEGITAAVTSPLVIFSVLWEEVAAQ